MSGPFIDPFLESILSQPSAPFREGHVIRVIQAKMKAEGVPSFQDPVGNLVLGAANKKEFLARVKKATKEPLRIFIAHMDHPGFHGVRWASATQLEIQWHGGAPTQHLEGAKVWLADRNGWVGEANFATAKTTQWTIDRATLACPAELSANRAEDLFGGFAFRAPVWLDGERIYTKAADDLVGAFCVSKLAMEFKKERPNFLGILTRAEEVGFIGALAHFEQGWLKNPKRPLICVSLETSRTLPNAEIGKGPVVRLGDKFTVFSCGPLRVFADLASAKMEGRHQKRVMDGGTCEATAAVANGLDAIGISVPLGNYHNQSFEGGPDSRGSLGPAPEFVHVGDIAGLLELCGLILREKAPWADPFKKKREDFKANLKKYRPLLKSTP